MINLQYEVRIWQKILNKEPQMTKTSQDNNGIIVLIISFFKAFLRIYSLLKNLSTNDKN